VNLLRNTAKLLEAKFLRFPVKKFAQIQTTYVNCEDSYGKRGFKIVDIDPLPNMPLL